MAYGDEALGPGMPGAPSGISGGIKEYAKPYPVKGDQGNTEAARQAVVREFETGATRDSEDGKFDYEGFLSPIVLERYGAYMHKHRTQSDGTIRDSDNWQKGMPAAVYIKSLIRHVVDIWKLWRGYIVKDLRTGLPVDIEDSACAILFNVMGFLQVRLKPGSVRLEPFKVERFQRIDERIAREINKPADPDKWPSHRPQEDTKAYQQDPTPKGWYNPSVYRALKREIGQPAADEYAAHFKDYGQYERFLIEGADHKED